MSVEQSLAQFQETESPEAFSLQNSKLLKVELADVTIQAKLGSMVAYQGDVTFEHAGSGGVSKFLKKAATGEGTNLIQLEDDKITANGANVLAFDAGIDWDIKRVEGASSALAGGLYNMELAGSGRIALVSDGPPLLLQLDGEQTFADPQAAITWSSGVSTSVKTDVNVKTLVGRGSGETVQVGFSGSGWLLIQPSEGRVAGAAGSGGGQGGVSGALCNLLGG